MNVPRRGGGTGRRRGLKIPRQQWLAGSTPALGISNKIKHLRRWQRFRFRGRRHRFRAAIVPERLCPHIGHMRKTREDAVRQALRLYPDSILSLAREAGVSARLLRMIRDGTRSATPATTAAVAEALERLGERHQKAAGVLREALKARRGDA